MRVYISGRITGDPEYMRRFAAAQKRLEEEGWEVVNPAAVTAPLPPLSHDEYMRIDKVLVDMSDALYFLDGWRESAGARMEMRWAQDQGKRILYEVDPRVREDVRRGEEEGFEEFLRTGNIPIGGADGGVV